MDLVPLATIQDKGNYPCPLCWTLKILFNCTGYLRDTAQRMKWLCIYFSEKVFQACNAIYTHGASIKGGLVECLLKLFSLVPVVVSLIFLYALSDVSWHPFRIALWIVSHHWALIFSSYLWSIYLARQLLNTENNIPGLNASSMQRQQNSAQNYLSFLYTSWMPSTTKTLSLKTIYCLTCLVLSMMAISTSSLT